MKDYLYERLPRRGKWFKAALTMQVVGWFLMPTIIGTPIGFLLIVGSLFPTFMQFRYPVTKVTCPMCERKLKVELDVQSFHCYCHNRLEKDGEEWKVC